MSENNIARPFRIFDGKANNKATRIFGGESSGICDWDDIKYPHILDLNKQMFGEFWVEDEIRLGDDINQYRRALSDEERKVYNIITGYLTTLDSVANKFNFVLGYISTDSSIQQTIQLIGAFEGLHARSYQYLTSTMLSFEEKKLAFETPKTNELLIKRNKPVFEEIQKMVDNPNDMQNIFRSIIANLVLEGLYFTGGFVYFHALARSNRMIGSNNMISLIRFDEQLHSIFWGEVLKILMAENEELNTQENLDWAIDFIKNSVELEKQWSSSLFQNVDILSIREYHDYIEYLANIICRNSGLGDIYSNNTDLKSKWILTYGSKKTNNNADAIPTRADFFQTNVVNYSHEGGEGFDL
jgi:ribonucleoside-diphosphate reductase beta chain